MGSGRLSDLRRSPRSPVLRPAVSGGRTRSATGGRPGLRRGQPDFSAGTALAGRNHRGAGQLTGNGCRRARAGCECLGRGCEDVDAAARYRRGAQQRRHALGARASRVVRPMGRPTGGRVVAGDPDAGQLRNCVARRGARRGPTPAVRGAVARHPFPGRHCGRYTSALRRPVARQPGARSTPGKPRTFISSPASIPCWIGSAAPRCCR